MRSVRRASAACAAGVPVAMLLTGCVSTQQIAARARLVNARILASQRPTRVVRPNPAVSVGTPVMIGSRSGTAIVVSLRNDTASALTDLPISVGVRSRPGRRVYLNQSANLDYFETHVPAIGPHAAIVWVFTTSRRVSGGRPFAVVGFSQRHPSTADDLPHIVVSSHGPLSVSVSNRSVVPQYDLPVYVVATRAGRDVAAGSATVAHLGTYGKTTLRVNLLGNARRATLRLFALPTIFS